MSQSTNETCGRCPASATPQHNPCCSSHGVPLCCEHYRRTHFCEVRLCCGTDAVRLGEEHGPRKGVTVNGGKAHVRDPGTLRPRTRCGRALRAPNLIEEVDDVNQLTPLERCAKCFPGTGEPTR